MALTWAEALAELKTTSATPDALRQLAAQVAVDASGTVTLTYSGTVDGTPTGISNGDMARVMAAADPNIRIIDNTAASNFVNSKAFMSKVGIFD